MHRHGHGHAGASIGSSPYRSCQSRRRNASVLPSSYSTDSDSSSSGSRVGSLQRLAEFILEHPHLLDVSRFASPSGPHRRARSRLGCEYVVATRMSVTNGPSGCRSQYNGDITHLLSGNSRSPRSRRNSASDTSSRSRTVPFRFWPNTNSMSPPSKVGTGRTFGSGTSGSRPVSSRSEPRCAVLARGVCLVADLLKLPARAVLVPSCAE